LQAYEGTADVVLKENGGQASAINAGIARCRGDVVMLLDADDVLKPHAAAGVAAAFAAEPDAVKVQSRMDVIDGQGHPTGAMKPHPGAPMLNGDLRRAELAFPFDLPWVPTSGNAFRIEALRRILPIPEEEYPICGGELHLIHLSALLGPVVSLKEVGASYRVHGRNSYELQAARLDLGYATQTIDYWAATARALARLADELDLDRPDRILSLADLAHRLISRKLQPDAHPVPGDRVGRLVADAIRASGRRFDISWPMKVVFVGWFILTAASPRQLARRLAELFLFPERRPRLNRLLHRLRRGVFRG
jgi:cellulose synthase/poly-beta-1,6-N-acetylglucosamine synthase-like glycosyltransferase